jgi:hypothetical protein
VGRSADHIRHGRDRFALAGRRAVNVVIAWLIVLAGVVHLMLGVRTHGAGSMIWKLLVGSPIFS